MTAATIPIWIAVIAMTCTLGCQSSRSVGTRPFGVTGHFVQPIGHTGQRRDIVRIGQGLGRLRLLQ